MSNLHRVGGQFAAFCIDSGVNLLRSALIWGRFAASCLDLGSICCALPRFGAKWLRPASMVDQVAMFCLSSEQREKLCGEMAAPRLEGCAGLRLEDLAGAPTSGAGARLRCSSGARLVALLVLRGDLLREAATEWAA